MSLFGISSLGL